jgi:hypothetical protein
MSNHPITTPFEMVEEWARMLEYHRDEHVFSKIAQWGADQELEACCAEVSVSWNGNKALAVELRTARRPKPPSLKEQALDELAAAERLYPADWSTIRKALGALPND